jgi:4-aminobutyrate aminotransferase
VRSQVQSGVARTGKMWAVDHEDVVPDVLISAKGLASGYPLAAVFARAELSAKQAPNSCGGTYGGNAVACAAASATLDVIASENLAEHALKQGKRLKDGFHRLAEATAAAVEGQPLVGDIRGRGLMLAIEFRPGAAASCMGVPVGSTVASAVSKAAFDRGMLLLPTVSVLKPVALAEVRTQVMLFRGG